MINIAVDGPSGAGKSTIARLLAAKLGYLYADTGALYRAVALGCVNAAIDLKNPAEVERLLPGLDISLAFADGGQRVILNGEDVTGAVRAPDISRWASKLSVLPAVRAFLLERQRELARENNIIMDGRDIGTVILPNACIKIFLTATAEDRARRRWEELAQKDSGVDYQTVLNDVIERDSRDENRAVAPARRADDAELIDTTGDTLEQSVETLEKYIMKRLVELNVL